MRLGEGKRRDAEGAECTLGTDDFETGSRCLGERLEQAAKLQKKPKNNLFSPSRFADCNQEKCPQMIDS